MVGPNYRPPSVFHLFQLVIEYQMWGVINIINTDLPLTSLHHQHAYRLNLGFLDPTRESIPSPLLTSIGHLFLSPRCWDAGAVSGANLKHEKRINMDWQRIIVIGVVHQLLLLKAGWKVETNGLLDILKKRAGYWYGYQQIVRCSTGN